MKMFKAAINTHLSQSRGYVHTHRLTHVYTDRLTPKHVTTSVLRLA